MKKNDVMVHREDSCRHHTIHTTLDIQFIMSLYVLLEVSPDDHASPSW